MKNNILIKKIKSINLKKIQLKKTYQNNQIKKSNQNRFIKNNDYKNVNETKNINLDDFTSKYNKIITSLNNKINNSEFINNEKDLLKIYLEELNDFYNGIIKVF